MLVTLPSLSVFLITIVEVPAVSSRVTVPSAEVPFAPVAPVSPLSPLGPVAPVAPAGPVAPPPITLNVYSLEPFEVIVKPSPAISFRTLFDTSGLYVYVPAAVPEVEPLKPSNVNGVKFSTRFATANNCEPLIASVELELIRPAATFWIWRSLPEEPTETTAPLPKPLVAPAKPPYVWLPTVALDVGTNALVVESEPNATAFAIDAFAFEPSAVAPAIDAFAFEPSAVASSLIALVFTPIATALEPVAFAVLPSATAVPLQSLSCGEEEVFLSLLVQASD